MDWTERLDTYCERTDAGLLSEPLNLVTNAGFLIVAALAARRYARVWRRAGRRDPWIEVELALLAAIGVGSGLFHSVATRWAMVADVAPITALLFVYLAHFLARVVGLGARGVAAGLAAFVAVSAAASLIPPAWFNDSQSYFGALAAMVGLAAMTRATVGPRIAAAAAVFVVSLGFRSIDLAVCDAVPIGTHFLWHASNSVLLWILMAALIDGARPGARG